MNKLIAIIPDCKKEYKNLEFLKLIFEEDLKEKIDEINLSNKIEEDIVKLIYITNLLNFLEIKEKYFFLKNIIEKKYHKLKNISFNEEHNNIFICFMVKFLVYYKIISGYKFSINDFFTFIIDDSNNFDVLMHLLNRNGNFILNNKGKYIKIEYILNFLEKVFKTKELENCIYSNNLFLIIDIIIREIIESNNVNFILKKFKFIYVYKKVNIVFKNFKFNFRKQYLFRIQVL
jgi:hypothetical protein